MPKETPPTIPEEFPNFLGPTAVLVAIKAYGEQQTLEADTQLGILVFPLSADSELYTEDPFYC